MAAIKRNISKRVGRAIAYTWPEDVIYVTMQDVLDRYEITRATLYRWMDLGVFPKPIEYQHSVNRWSIEELRKWEDETYAQI